MEKENGRKEIPKQVRYLIHMKVITTKIRRADMGSSNGTVVISTKDIIKTMKDMDMEKCIGLMVQFTKVLGVKESRMA
jgi:uncharacterized protein YjgD (DUF1641 family)